jgi:hypothetical protein
MDIPAKVKKRVICVRCGTASKKQYDQNPQLDAAAMKKFMKYEPSLRFGGCPASAVSCRWRRRLQIFLRPLTNRYALLATSQTAFQGALFPFGGAGRRRT